MVNEDKEEHQKANKEGNFSSKGPYRCGIVSSDLKFDTLALERHLVGYILKSEI